MNTAIICTAILGALVFALGANVTRLRAMRGKSGGPQASTDPADQLFIAVRAHGNAIEYVPTLIVLFLLVAWQGASWWTVTITIAATAARLVHALGMLSSKTLAAPTPAREAGAGATYLTGLALAITAVVGLA